MIDWVKYAEKGDLRAVIDPSDTRGHKNRYINLLHHMILEERVGDLTGKRVLDLGCGNGRFSKFLQGKGAIVYGVDSCQEMLDQNNISHKYRVPVTELPFENDFFDAVLSVWTLQHLDTVSLVRASNEIERVLKSRGNLYLIEQTSKKKRTRYGYLGAFGDLCEEVYYRPIMYAYDRVIDFVRIGVIPEQFFPQLAKWHLEQTKYLVTSEDDYTDCFMEFVKI
jgi:ubiquinone/menaquinone biosynthesis C-methylase UbiE